MKTYMFGVIDKNNNVIENWMVASKTYRQAIERANDIIINYGHTKRTRVYLQETYLNNVIKQRHENIKRFLHSSN